MNFSNINTVARYEAKIVRRSWLFRAFALFSLLGVLSLQIQMQGNMVEWTSWNMIAMSSYVPYFNVYLFGVVQALAVIFLASDLLNADRKIDTEDMIYIRCGSKVDYLIGNICSIVLIFIGLSFLSLLSGSIIHLFFTDAPFNGGVYLFYGVVFLFPSLVFILGFTVLLETLIPHKATVICVMLEFILVSLYYLNNPQQGLFNFWGFGIPTTLSDISGYPDLGGVVLQRLIWLFLGVGFIGYSVVLLKRIPARTGNGVVQLGVPTLLVVIGLACGLYLFIRQHENVSCRDNYRATYEKYSSGPKLTLNDQIITYRQDGDKIEVKTRLRLKNECTGKVSPVILYLNPGLRVKWILKNGEEVDFSRENQVIVIDDTVEEKGILDLEVEYAGTIDESICYLEFPDKYVAGTWNIGSELFRSGKRYAILQKNYTLLTPECIWYPVSVPPVNLSDLYAIEKNFTKYGLQVVGENGRTVLSQGDRSEAGDTLIFRNKHGLPGISLCIGHYKSYKVMVDSVSFELYLVDGHDDFMENLSNIKDSVPGVIREFKRKVEQQMNRKYPFERFMAVEAPVSFAAYFRIESGGSGRVQPEMVFLPERGVGIKNMKLKKIQAFQNIMTPADMENIERNVLTQLLDGLFASEYDLSEHTTLRNLNPLIKLFVTYSYDNFTLNGNPFTLFPLFYNYVNQLYAPEYPIMDIVLNSWLSEKDVTRTRRINSQSTLSRSYKQAMNYLKTHSLQEALKDCRITSDILYQLIKLKSNSLKEHYFGLTVSPADLDEFIKRFREEHTFEKIDFSLFDEAFTEQFGISWSSVLPEWYTINRIPSFLIRDTRVEEIDESKEGESFDDRRYRIQAKVYNESDVDGVVTLSFIDVVKRGSDKTSFVSNEMKFLCTQNVLIKAKEGKEIVIVTRGRPSAVFLNTIISNNMPTVVVLEETGGMTRKIDPGIKDIDLSHFLPKEGELIVDNESDGFSLLQPPVGNRSPEWQKPVYSTDKYNTYNMMLASEAWTLVTHYGFYGERVRSGWMKKSGDGEFKAKWSVKIEKAGYYEVLAYIPSYVELQQKRGISSRTLSPMNAIKQNYLVQHDSKETEISLEIIALNTNWISLGCFYFSPGDASVVLTDKGSVDDQVIYADAVKWVLDGDNKMCEK